MVLVPGPHFLNGALDLINGRLELGAARLIYAGLIVVAISVGLLLGLALFGVSLPTDPAPRRARHSARIPPQRSKIKTAKGPNREALGPPILLTVTLAVPA